MPTPQELAALIVALGGIYAAWATHRRGVMDLLHKHSEKQAEERLECQKELKKTQDELHTTRSELQAQITQQSLRIFEVEKENRSLQNAHANCPSASDIAKLQEEVRIARVTMDAWKQTTTPRDGIQGLESDD